MPVSETVMQLDMIACLPYESFVHTIIILEEWKEYFVEDDDDDIIDQPE